MSFVEPISEDAPPLVGPTLMSQDWVDLAYVHWAVEPDRVSGMMPAGVRPDVLNGVTYVGLVPFSMRRAGPSRGLPVPYLGTFLEINVRLYSVDSTGRRGVVFLSLDTDRLAVVLGARLVFSTPYRWARMRHAVRDGGRVHEWTTQLRDRSGRPRRATNRLVLEVGERREASALDVFLSARWGLHTSVLGRTLYVPNEHGAWPLNAARILELDDQLVASVGLPGVADREPDHAAFSTGVHTRFGFPMRASRPRPVPISA